MNKEDLKPCPFCGKKMDFEEDFFTTKKANGLPFIMCDCGAKVIHDFEEDLIAAWNQRVAGPDCAAKDTEIARLSEENTALKIKAAKYRLLTEAAIIALPDEDELDSPEVQRHLRAAIDELARLKETK